ncbi:MAG: acyl-CoA carboxylase subunit beta [Longimicrobiales bacterium]|nr:acyl-CoA carboxylase subunit beta [Longimicrobiales bacterium]
MSTQDEVEELRRRLDEYARPPSEKAVEKQHAKDKLTVHERLDILLDEAAPSFEVATFAAMDQYQEHRDIRSAGVRTVVGRVSERDCMVIANDSMVKSGTWFPLTIKKILRAQEIALENRLPLIYLVDSGGLFLPLQDESFPDKDDAGRIFYHNARISAEGIPQIAAVMGPCVAGGAYIPALCDELLMVEGTSGIFLGGPHLVKAAIGEEADIEELGGSSTHTRLSGMADYEDPDEESCLARVRRLAARWPAPPGERPAGGVGARDRGEGGTVASGDAEAFDGAATGAGYAVGTARAPERDPEELLDLLPDDRSRAYEMRTILECILDGESWEEYKREYGKSLLCGTARIHGRTVGIVASQRAITRTGEGEMQIGGVIYGDAADKAARFVLMCNQKQLPLIFFQDVTGFMVGTRAERGGIIKDGAKLINAVSNSRVPKMTVVVGNSYGAGNYALCGRAFGPRFVLAWPSASIAVMAGKNAAETILAIEKRKKEKGGEELTGPEEEAILDEIREAYERTLSPYYAASNLWVDALVDPRSTRDVLGHLLRVACAHPPDEEFRLGVFQV